MLIYFILGFAPGVYWLYYFFNKDKLEPEPKKLLIKLYFFGIISAAIVIGLQLPFNLNYLVSAIIVAPILEELCKFTLTYLGSYRNRNFNEPMDGIMYAVAVALGFASIENAFYLLRAASFSKDIASNLIIIRSILSVPAHALFSSFWGYALGRIKLQNPRHKTRILVMGLIFAMLAHALFNLFCILGNYASAALLILVAVLWEIVRRNIDRAEIDSPFASEKTGDA